MITIQKLEPEYFTLCAEWLSRPDINRWLTAEWRGRTIERTTLAVLLRNKRNRVWLSVYDERPCGIVAIADLEAGDGTGMAWYILGESRHQGKGITSKALRQMCARAMMEFNLKSLYAWAMEDNVASCRVLEKAGFRPAGRIRLAAISGGRNVDRLYFDIIAEDVEPSALDCV